jgi:hypothetical protein
MTASEEGGLAQRVAAAEVGAAEAAAAAHRRCRGLVLR